LEGLKKGYGLDEGTRSSNIEAIEFGKQFLVTYVEKTLQLGTILSQ